MRNTLYRQMVYWINMYRTWIKVADDNLYKEHIISRSDRTDYAEAIIRLATYGIVRLELVIPPVPVREKPYYL